MVAVFRECQCRDRRRKPKRDEMKRSIALMGCLALFLFVALSGCAPRDQEGCVARAAKEAKTNDALKVLVRNCESEFPAKRRDDGTYAYFDAQTEEWIDVSGPKLSDADIVAIEELRSQKVENLSQKASRNKKAIQDVSVERFDISCEGSLCWEKNITVLLKNKSEYRISGVKFGYEIGENLDCTGSFGKEFSSDIAIPPGGTASIVKKLALNVAGPEGVTTGCLRVNAIENALPPIPEVGFIEDGYRFMGGDPANPASWREVGGSADFK